MNNNEKKYELIETPFNTLYYNDGNSFQIRALKDFGDVKKGDLGGYINNESCLSHDGDCWVYQKAYVGNGCFVSDNSKVCNGAIIVGNVKIHGDSLIDGRVIISGYNMEIDCTKIFQIYDDYSVHISGNYLKLENCVILESLSEHHKHFTYAEIFRPNDIFHYGNCNSQIDIVVYRAYGSVRFEGFLYGKYVEGDYEKMIDTFLERYNNSSPKDRDGYDAIITAIDKWLKDKNFKFDVYTKKQ